MKAPDKIYIQTYKGETIPSKWTTIPFRDFENTEYIRKDALIEWLIEGYGWVQNPLIFVPNLIDKLNSM